MIIEHRDSNIKYTRAIKDEKTRLVLGWLLEFRFSSFDILAARIGLNPKQANHFINGLFKQGVIRFFKNVHTNNHKYVMLTHAGINHLQVLGGDVSHANTRAANFANYSQIIHDLSVQTVVVSRLSTYSEVIWERNIAFASQYSRPDVILKAEKDDVDYWVAIEFERSRKERKRIFISFLNQAKHIKNKRLIGVLYLFQSEADCFYYKKLFDEREWPKYERSTKTGHIKSIGTSFIPDTVEDLRKRYVFRFEPVSF